MPLQPIYVSFHLSVIHCRLMVAAIIKLFSENRFTYNKFINENMIQQIHYSGKIVEIFPRALFM